MVVLGGRGGAVWVVVRGGCVGGVWCACVEGAGALAEWWSGRGAENPAQRQRARRAARPATCLAPPRPPRDLFLFLIPARSAGIVFFWSRLN